MGEQEAEWLHSDLVIGISKLYFQKLARIAILSTFHDC
jgi:hypothetical protein